jgi:AcrR family transcriptional regulator
MLTLSTPGRTMIRTMAARARSTAKAHAYHHGDLRTALLAAASEVLREHGVDGISLRECARRVGVSHAAPYRHFATKEALVAALAVEGFGWLRDWGAKAMVGKDDPLERLHAYGVAYVRFALKHPDRFRLMFAHATDLSCDPGAEAAAGGAYGLLRECVLAVVGETKDLDYATLAFWSVPHGLAMLILDGRIPKAQVATAQAVEGLTRGCLAYFHA